MAFYEVLIDGADEVYQGESRSRAVHFYHVYVALSRNKEGRAAGKPITLVRDDETVLRFNGG